MGDASAVSYGRPGDFLVTHRDPGKAGRGWLPCFIGFYYYLGAARPAGREPTATEKRAGPRGGARALRGQREGRRGQKRFLRSPGSDPVRQGGQA